uniref:BED-type domain-containing protein n=1 Tax=Anopheles culicifacies TaxID=139723 RepID=A0A182MAB6_9DIPT
MPNQLQSNAMVWLYFTDDAVAKKGKCMYCGQLISYEKSTYSNLTRHLKRRHPNVLDNVSKKYNTVEFIQQDEDRLYNGPPSLQDAIEETFKTPELGIESNLNAIEMMPDNGTSSGKIEYMNTNSHSKINENDQEVIEEIVHDAKSLQDVQYSLGSKIWIHFVKEPGKRARCRYCGSNISYQYTTSSLARHIRIKHPNISLEGEITPDIHSQDYEKLYQDEAVPNSVEGLISANESDGEFEGRNGGLIELQPVKNAELSEPIKLEVRHFDQGSTEQNDSEQEYDMTEILEETVIGQIIDPIKTADTTDAGFAKYENTRKGQNSLGFDMRHISTKAAAYATHVALEIESLHPRQRAIAQKLISDIMFNGKLGNLTEHSMLVVRVGTFERE